MRDVRDVRDAAGDALCLSDPDQKCVQVAALAAAWPNRITLTATPGTPLEAAQAGRPPRPLLVSPRELPKRPLGSAAGRVTLIHAVAHIEFNAINLALDAVHRFRDLPPDYYADWLSVAADEARHFQILRGRLRELDSDYGAMSAHGGLWDAAARTAGDALARMALVPRVLEARGLDVTPAMIVKLRKHGDDATAALLEQILAEEVGHVAIGTRWFHYLCGERGLDPESTFRLLVTEHYADGLRGPFNLDARRKAGFSSAELAWLDGGV